VSHSDPNIYFEGIMEKEVVNGNLRLYRMKKDYIYAAQGGTFTGGLSSSGIKMKFKTSSPSVKVHFNKNTIEGQDKIFSFDVLKDGKYDHKETSLGLTLTNPASNPVEWTIVFPAFITAELIGIELKPGYSLLPVSYPSKKVYVAIGNSITHGQGLYKSSTYNTYPYLVADSLNYELHNWAIGGSKIGDVVFENFSTGLIPDLVTVLWGYNDVHSGASASDMETYTYPQYESLLTQIASQFPSACVMVILPTYTTEPNGKNGKTIPSLSARQQQIVENLKLTYPNLSFFDGESFTSAFSLNDVVHMNYNGQLSLSNGIIANMCPGPVTGVSVRNRNDILVSPNPSEDIINITGDYESLQIINTLGQVMLNSSKSDQSVAIANLPAGSYYLLLIKGQSVITKSFVKK